MSDEIKYCKFCNKEKPIKEFVKSGFAIKNICRECQNKKQAQIYRDSKKVKELEKENQELKKQLEELDFIVGLRQKRNLIHKFDKEYDEEDKKKNPNRDYAGIMPDAEEVYKRYYAMKKQQKEFIEYLEKEINERTIDIVNYHPSSQLIIEKIIEVEKMILEKYKEIVGDIDESV